MNIGRGSHGLIKLNSLIYVFGGLDGAAGETAENYDLATDTWTMIDNRIPVKIWCVN